MTEPLSIERLTVRQGRLVCDVALAPGAPRITTPAMATRIRAAFPSLARHACVNDEGDTFAAVMDHTSLPHVLEHLVIDAQVRTAAEAAATPAATPAAAPTIPSDAVFVGTTEWTDEFAGKARVEVSFTDDLVALRAFRDAACFLNNVVVSYRHDFSTPDIRPD